MKNKIIISSLALLMLLPTSAMAKERQFKLTIKNQPVTINKEIGYPYINKDERTMVPIRVISENLGYQVDWNQEDKIATITKDDKLIALKNEKNFAVINNKKVPLGVKADGSWEKTSVKIKDDRTYVPLRFIAEAMNEKVDYKIDKNFHYINISSTGKQANQKGEKLVRDRIEIKQKNFPKDYLQGFELEIDPIKNKDLVGVPYQIELISPNYTNLEMQDVFENKGYIPVGDKFAKVTDETINPQGFIHSVTADVFKLYRDAKTKKPIAIPKSGDVFRYKITFNLPEGQQVQIIDCVMP